MVHWVILTGEYPPQRGGVSDYTRLVAEGLAASGDVVTVYAPSHDAGPDSASLGVRVVRLPDCFGVRGLRVVDRALSGDRPDRVLIQYVPHAFGMKAMNLLFATWVALRARRIAPVWVMFHEVAFPFVWRPLRHNVVAIANRMMARILAGAADRLFVSIPGWGPLIDRICPGAAPGEWLPVPCNVATVADPASVALARSHHAPDPRGLLVGHFGTFGRLITGLLEPTIVGLLRSWPLARVLLIGHGSDRFQLHIVAAYPELAGRVSATGELSPAGVTAHLRACDLLIQPYQDGISSRRTSVMAGLANQVPVVTNLGALSEPFWAESSGLAVVPCPDPVALAAASGEVLMLAPESRLAFGERGAELYFRTFALERTITRLRQNGPVPDRSHPEAIAHATNSSGA